MYRLRRQTKTKRQTRASTDRIHKVNNLIKQREKIIQQYNCMKNKGDYSDKFYHYERYIHFLNNKIDIILKHI